MNLPNMVTGSRIALSPFFFLVFFLPHWFEISATVPVIVVWVLFLLIEFSDLYDGQLARKLDQISDTGKLLDPFADSLSRLTYFLCFTMAGFMPVWVFLIILYRDLTVAFVRLLVSRRGVAMSARRSGKIKALIYAVAGAAGLAYFTVKAVPAASGIEPAAGTIVYIVFLVAALVAIWSTVDYLSVLFIKKKT